MQRHRWYGWLFLVLAGGALFQTTSCSAQLTDAVVSSLSSSLSTIIQDQVTTSLNQLLGTSSST